MKTLEILQTIMQKMPGISQPFSKFSEGLVTVLLSGKGRYTFLNMARWSAMCERTFRRNYQKAFDFQGFNQWLIDSFLPGQTWIAVSDCSHRGAALFLKVASKLTAWISTGAAVPVKL